MMESININLPEKLKRYKDKIEETIKPYINIKLKRQKTLLWESKLGGDPYLEIGMEYPRASSGEYLRLLVQINFEEVPDLENFPKKGILQIFILADDVYGLDFKDSSKQDTFRVIYIPNVIKDETNLVKDFSFLGELEEEWYMPFSYEGKMEFILKYMPISWSDYRFDNTFKDIKLTEEERNAYLDELSGDGCRMGGYPIFVQYDPRENEKLRTFDTLLLQLDCEDECDLMFGDGGIANFFINEEDLKKLDFTKVLYNWDCC